MTCLEARLRISFFLLLGTESFALAPRVPWPTALLRPRTLINERLELTNSGWLADSMLVVTSIVMNSGNEHRDDLAIAGVHHNMSELIEAPHEAAQRLLWVLRQRQKVIKGPWALVPALEHVNELLAQIFP
jgi:hypothetical protein